MSRLRRNRPGSSIVATKASAVVGPTQGTDIKCQHGFETRIRARTSLPKAAIRPSIDAKAYSNPFTQA